MPSFSIPAAIVSTTGLAATGGASILADVGLVGSALSGVVGAIGAERSASAQKAASEYQAQVSANNALIAEQNAKLTEAAGSTQAEAQGLKNRQAVGAIKAAQAASNIDVNSGSALDVRSSAAELGQVDALTTRANTEKQVYGYQTQATSFTGQEALQKSEAADAGAAGGIGAFTSLLSGATGVASQYAQWQNVAGTPPSNIGL